MMLSDVTKIAESSSTTAKLSTVALVGVVCMIVTVATHVVMAYAGFLPQRHQVEFISGPEVKKEKQKNTELKQQYESLKMQNGRQQQRNENLTNRIAELRKENDQLEQQSKNLKNQHDEMSKQIRVLELANAENVRRVRHLTQQLNNAWRRVMIANGW